MFQEIRVAIVDDHPVVLEGMKHILSRQEAIKLVGAYQNGPEAINGIAHHPADVLLMDIKMPGPSGVQLLEMLPAKFPGMKVIVLTYLDQAYYIKTMMNHGASGYLLKTSAEESVIEAIKAVYAGEKYLEINLKESLLAQTVFRKKVSAEIPVLTRREQEILQLIASEYTSQEIADKLYLSKRTVENHRANLLIKFKTKNSASMVKKAMEMNLLRD